ncbi:MAG: hypothetical protein K2N16_07355, partial [Muribaculaceae bacterium]|nr:hypothetical protein [Muribaculaceae bacterium]
RKKGRPLDRKPELIFLTLEIVPIGNLKKGLCEESFFIYIPIIKGRVLARARPLLSGNGD